MSTTLEPACECGGLYSLAQMKVVHALRCPKGVQEQFVKEQFVKEFEENYTGEEFKKDEVAAPVVSVLKPVGVSEADKEAAIYFRELADRIDAGDIGNIVVAFNDKAGNHYERYGNWRDRWQMLGALEYAKFAIDKTD